MFVRKSGIGAVCALSLLLGATAPVSAAGAEPTRAEAFTFAFKDAEITQVVEEVLGQAGVPFVIDPSVQGKLSFRIEQRLTRDQLIAALEAVLSINGVALVRNGDQVTVTPQAKARMASGVRQGRAGSGGAGYEVVAVPLAYAQPTEVAKAMEAISEANTVIYANDKIGLLLIGGSGVQLKSSLETLKIFDQNAFQDTKIRWFELNQAQASTVAAELDKIVQGAGLVGMSVVPLKRLNGLIVFGRSQESLDEIGRWVSRLDTAGKEVGSSLWVYRPRNTSAESLARTLNGVLGYQTRIEESSSSAPPAAGASAPPVVSSVSGSRTEMGDDDVRVAVDKDTNTLLLFAAPPRWVQIQRILNEIDRPARQVFIEASILEVTLGKEFEFGVDWKVFSKDLAISSVNNATGFVGPGFPGLSITYVNSDIEAAVKALGSRTTLEVVSAPKIIALDNRAARLQIGDQVPVVTQSAQSTANPDAPLVSTVEYRSTGVILNVTPRITGENQVLLDVSQEVSSVAKTVTSGIDSPTIQQRRFESVLLLQDGGVVALGGLISSNRTTSDKGVPGLKDVPVLGGLFKTQGQNQTRRELIILLSAKIIGDQLAANNAMADLAADMQELQSRGMLPANP